MHTVEGATVADGQDLLARRVHPCIPVTLNITNQLAGDLDVRDRSRQAARTRSRSGRVGGSISHQLETTTRHAAFLSWRAAITMQAEHPPLPCGVPARQRRPLLIHHAGFSPRGRVAVRAVSGFCSATQLWCTRGMGRA
jgi:hypothetical protein